MFTLITTVSAQTRSLKPTKSSTELLADRYVHCLQKLDEQEIYDKIFALATLTTLELTTMQVSLTLIGRLSQVTTLRSLTVGPCSYFYIFENLHDSLLFNFDGLRKLRLMGQTEVLQHIRCKALDLLAIEPGNSCRTCASDVIAFLNDLDRCEEINIELNGFFFCRGTILLNPKFMWHKLKLCYSTINQRSDMPELPFVEALCRASTADSESEIDLRYLGDHHQILWAAVINNCLKIKTLRLSNSIIPVDLSQLRKVPELRKLVVDQETSEHENFNCLLQIKLTGVSYPEILQWFWPEPVKATTKQLGEQFSWLIDDCLQYSIHFTTKI